jgi:hypothetical protein
MAKMFILLTTGQHWGKSENQINIECINLLIKIL